MFSTSIENMAVAMASPARCAEAAARPAAAAFGGGTGCHGRATGRYGAIIAVATGLLPHLV